MIPDDRFSSVYIPGDLFNPFVLNRQKSMIWGPVAIQDPSQGQQVQIWTAVADDLDLKISAPNTPQFVFFSRSTKIRNISLAFDLNGSPCVAFQDGVGSFLYWFDPVPNAFVFFEIPNGGAYPVVTLDEYRPALTNTADVILGYIRAEAIKYRQLRDRFTIEYSPTEGVGGPPVKADILYFISITSKWRLEFMYGLLPKIHRGPHLMKMEIFQQKAPVEILDFTFNFDHLMLFGDTIDAAQCTVTVHSGEDANPSALKDGAATFTDRTATQTLQGGTIGVIYLISMAVHTTQGCVLVYEGYLTINPSPAEAP